MAFRIFSVAPERLASLEQAVRGDVPAPLPPPRGYDFLTDKRWAALKKRFKLPDVAGGVSIRAQLEWVCIGLVEDRKYRNTLKQRKKAHNALRWLAKASNVGKQLKLRMSPEVVSRLSAVATKVNEAAEREFLRPDKLSAATLTLEMQMCAMICWTLAPRWRGLTRPPYIIGFYVALWRLWVRDLERKPKIWAHENGATSKLVEFVTCVLRHTGERLPSANEVAHLRVRARLQSAMKKHRREFTLKVADLTKLDRELAEGVSTEAYRLHIRRRTRKAGFSRTRARLRA